jgi:hypothetical protein
LHILIVRIIPLLSCFFSSGDSEIIMNVLWQRLGNTLANWRHVYKALAVIEYLLANGTERAADGIVDNSSRIAVWVLR